MNKTDLLSFEEMTRLMGIFGDLGISKIRITGGEPFVRRGIMDFLGSLSSISSIQEINITTNGTFTQDKIPELENLGIRSINLSLDSLDRQRFYEITRRDFYDQVMSTYHDLLTSSLDLKINMVVMQDRNIQDIYPMLELTQKHHLSVRFIEEMPFNGTEGQGNPTFWSMERILQYIESAYEVEKLSDPTSSTSYNYRIKGYTGSFGIIAAYTRSFCGSCNRIRLTPQGTLRTCLYSEGGVNFRDLMRAGATDTDLGDHLRLAIQHKHKDGFEAEKQRGIDKPASESMATIGG